MKAALYTDVRGRWGGRLAGLFSKKAVVDVPPTISEMKRFPYGQFQMRVSVAGDPEFVVEATTDLRNWTPVCADVARQGAAEVLDTSAANYSQRFYRIRSGDLTSPSVVGYAAWTVPPGFALIANPLQAADNRVEVLFPRMPEGATLTKFDTHLFKLSKNVFEDGKWSNPGETFVPGEGAILFNPTQEFKTLAMTGEVLQGDLSLPIPAGFSLRGSMVPVPGQLDTDLLFPVANDDVVHLYDRDRQKYLVYAFQSGKWTPEPPILAVGESFWVGKTNAGNWNRTLWLNQAEEQAAAMVAA